MKPALCLALMAFVTNVHAQDQGHVWYFGDHAGIRFDPGGVSVLHDGQTNYYENNHNEGGACIADPAGNLLFYSDGELVWDRNHQVMPHGDSLGGDHSAVHAALIVPVPGNANRYHLFALDSFLELPNHGPVHHVVDLCLNDGAGDVDTTTTSLLHAEFTEKMAVAQHANGIDYWVVTHPIGGNEFRAYPITAIGIGSPVISNAGAAHNMGDYSAIGQMKIAPNGEWIALAAGNGLSFAEVFHFDASTGMITDPIHFNVSGGCYGISFSPNSSKLYAASWDDLYQADLSSNNPSVILASLVVVTDPTNTTILGLQLGPDGRIYGAQSAALATINAPNEAYPLCGLTVNSINLEGAQVSYSLPSFIDSFNYPNTLKDCQSIGIGELACDGQLVVHPNPFVDMVSFTTRTGGYVQLTQVNGVHVFSKYCSAGPQQIHLPEVASGVYALRFVSSSGVVVTRSICKE